MRKPTFILAIDKDEIIGTAAYTEELFTTDTWGIGWVGGKGTLSQQRHRTKKSLKAALIALSNKHPKP
jgi:hypothetical protein